MFDFSGKTAFVTGAGGGIAGACSELLHRSGANLILTDLNEGAVKHLANRLDPTGTTVVVQHQDALSSEEADAAVRAGVAKFGSIDIVIVGAGLYQDQTVRSMTDAEWRLVLGVNLDGVFYTIRAAIPHLRDGAAVVTVASMAGHKGSLNHGHYAAAKGGVLTFTRTLALELAPRIRVNAVSPGLIETPMIKSLIEHGGSDLVEQSPLKRLGKPQEVAQAILFLCSDYASFITGETLHVNGGLYIAS